DRNVTGVQTSALPIFNGNPLTALLPTQVVTQPRVNKNTVVSYTHTLKPTLLNDFRIGYHRVGFDTLNPFATNGQPSAGSDLGIQIGRASCRGRWRVAL